jgi:hypothetical protein
MGLRANLLDCAHCHSKFSPNLLPVPTAHHKLASGGGFEHEPRSKGPREEGLIHGESCSLRRAGEINLPWHGRNRHGRLLLPPPGPCRGASARRAAPSSALTTSSPSIASPHRASRSSVPVQPDPRCDVRMRIRITKPHPFPHAGESAQPPRSPFGFAITVSVDERGERSQWRWRRQESRATQRRPQFRCV